MSESHEPKATHRHRSSANEEAVVSSGAHGGHHTTQPTVGEDAKENPAEGTDGET